MTGPAGRRYRRAPQRHFGDSIIYTQSSNGRVYRLGLTNGCPALATAEKLSARSKDGNIVCAGRRAQFVVKTAAGIKRCGVAEVRALSRQEAAALASAPRR